jgi:hypothetical protein
MHAQRNDLVICRCPIGRTPITTPSLWSFLTIGPETTRDNIHSSFVGFSEPKAAQNL